MVYVLYDVYSYLPPHLIYRSGIVHLNERVGNISSIYSTLPYFEWAYLSSYNIYLKCQELEISFFGVRLFFTKYRISLTVLDHGDNEFVCLAVVPSPHTLFNIAGKLPSEAAFD